MGFIPLKSHKIILIVSILATILSVGCSHRGSYEEGCLRLCDGLEERKRPFVNVFTGRCGC